MSVLNTYLEGLRYPTKFKAQYNEQEELYALAWDIVRDEVFRLQELGISYDKRGKKELAGKYYKAANIYVYIIHYALIIRNEFERQNKINTCFTYSDFSIDCVIGNLPCLSKEYGTDYVNTFSQILTLFGIDRQLSECSDCCLGISQMIINDSDDCSGFIIGDCGENTEITLTSSGEFELCEFAVNEFTQATGNNLYDNCN